MATRSSPKSPTARKPAPKPKTAAKKTAAETTSVDGKLEAGDAIPTAAVRKWLATAARNARG